MAIKELLLFEVDILGRPQQRKPLPVASVLIWGAVFWERSNILASLYYQVKEVTSLLCMEEKWCINVYCHFDILLKHLIQDL